MPAVLRLPIRMVIDMTGRLLLTLALLTCPAMAAGAKRGVTIVLVTDPATCAHCVTIDRKALPELKRRGFSLAKDLKTPADLHVVSPGEWNGRGWGDVVALPTWIILAGGRETGRITGARGAGEVARWLREGKP